MIPLAFGDTVTVHRYATGEPDDFGNDTPVWTDETVERCAVWGLLSQAGEVLTQGDLVTETLTLVIPVALAPTDEVTVSGTRYAVTGVPARLRSPLTGTDAGWQVLLTRVTG